MALAQWARRHDLDAGLAPNHFRKARRPDGCPRHCVHCRLRKLSPNRQERVADLRLRDGLRDAVA